MTMKRMVPIALLPWIVACQTTATVQQDEDRLPNLRGQVAEMLDEQADAWNRADLEGFLDYYWRSADLTFSSAGRTHHGWEATRQRYLRRYPSAAEMGWVDFSDIEIQSLAADAALVIGRWRVTADAESSEGNFSLVVRRIDGRWLIVHDHTSVTTPADAVE